MGLLANVINFSEIEPYIIDAIEKATFTVNLGNVDFSNTEITISTDKIEAILNNMVLSLNSVKSASDLMNTTSQDIATLIVSNNQILNDKIDNLSNSINNVLTSYNDIFNSLKRIEQSLGIGGISKVLGKMIKIPALANIPPITYNFEKNILLTGISLSQSAWNDVDSWSLKVNSDILFNTIYCKELGEFKPLTKFYPVPKNTDITITYNNSSSNNKILWIDLHYIEINEDFVTNDSEDLYVSPGDGV